MQKVFIDTGHSVKYSGASGIVSEVDWVRKIADALPQYVGKNIELVRIPDKFVGETSNNYNLIQRIKYIKDNAKESDLVISIHANYSQSSLASGVMAYYLGDSKQNPKLPALAKSYAEKCVDCVCKSASIGRTSDGVQPDTRSNSGRLGIVRDSQPVPVILVECGFVSSKNDTSISPMLYAKGIGDFISNIYPMAEGDNVLQIYPDDFEDAKKWASESGIMHDVSDARMSRQVTGLELLLVAYRTYIATKK